MSITKGGPISASEYRTHIESLFTEETVYTFISAIGGTGDEVKVISPENFRINSSGIKNVFVELIAGTDLHYAVTSPLGQLTLRVYDKDDVELFKVTFSGDGESPVSAITNTGGLTYEEVLDTREQNPGESYVYSVTYEFSLEPEEYKIEITYDDWALVRAPGYTFKANQTQNTVIAGQKVRLWNDTFTELLPEGTTLSNKLGGLDYDLAIAGRYGGA